MAQPRSDAAAWLFAWITGFWQENAEGGVSMEETARALGCSQDRIKRTLHRFAGMSPIRYYQRIRCERAITLLEGGESVKRETGLTPREYVRRYAGNGGT